jgi:hypothetical protein
MSNFTLINAPTKRSLARLDVLQGASIIASDFAYACA